MCLLKHNQYIYIYIDRYNFYVYYVYIVYIGFVDFAYIWQCLQKSKNTLPPFPAVTGRLIGNFGPRPA